MKYETIPLKPSTFEKLYSLKKLRQTWDELIKELIKKYFEVKK